VAVVIGGTVVADGRGSSRQRAEEAAARAALESLPELAADLAAPDDVAAPAP
jgi:dsRNA-specific ribonuclease